MVSIQFGTFESSTPGWFEWLSLFLTLLVSAVSIYYAYKLADKSFKKEQEAKEKDEKKLYENEINLLRKSLIDLITPIDGTLDSIDTTIREDLSHITIRLELNASFLKLINLNRIFHYEKDRIEQLNDVILYLNKLDIINDSIERDTKQFISTYNSLHNEYIKLLFELELKYFNLVDITKYDPKTYQLMSMVRNTELDYINRFALLRKDYITPVMNFSNTKREVVKEYITKLEEMSKFESFKEANEIKILCTGVKRQLLDLENLENSHIKLLNRYTKILKRSKSVFENYIN